MANTSQSSELLTRDDFRKEVFARDQGLCVCCSQAGSDAHHIVDRSLWPDGGYYALNGATLCGDCHLQAEQTAITCAEIYKAIGVTDPILPPQFDADEKIDHWGNSFLPNGLRIKGELFWEESVQKALAAGDQLKNFTKYVKYPRTFHFPWSPGNATGDKKHKSVDQFVGRRVVATVKMDGENTTFYDDYIHARSIDSRSHASRNWVKGFHATLKWQIPPTFRICGENLFAVHSIAYKQLPSWFMVFNIWDDIMCLGWDETVEYVQMLGLQTPKVIYDGIWDEAVIRELWKPEYDGERMEGIVVRYAESIRYPDWTRSTGKYVRKGHVQTDEHWMSQMIVKNGLRE